MPCLDDSRVLAKLDVRASSKEPRVLYVSAVQESMPSYDTVAGGKRKKLPKQDSKRRSFVRLASVCTTRYTARAACPSFDEELDLLQTQSYKKRLFSFLPVLSIF